MDAVLFDTTSQGDSRHLTALEKGLRSACSFEPFSERYDFYFTLMGLRLALERGVRDGLERRALSRSQ